VKGRRIAPPSSCPIPLPLWPPSFILMPFDMGADFDSTELSALFETYCSLACQRNIVESKWEMITIRNWELGLGNRKRWLTSPLGAGAPFIFQHCSILIPTNSIRQVFHCAPWALPMFRISIPFSACWPTAYFDGLCMISRCIYLCVGFNHALHFRLGRY